MLILVIFARILYKVYIWFDSCLDIFQHSGSPPDRGGW
jgi:hypothetical protein